MRFPLSKRDPFPYFDLKEEYEKINQLFHDKDAFSVQSRNSLQRDYYSYYDVLDEFFLQWHLRKACTSVEEMLYKLHISESNKITEGLFLDYVQFVMNAVEYVKEIVIRLPFDIHRDNYSIGNAIKDNCFFVLNKLNAEAKSINLEWCVVFKNDVATTVSIQSQELAPSIIEYLKIENRDNLERKAQILCSLYKQLEPQKKQLKDNGFDKLVSHTSFLLNEAGIRHALIPGKSNSIFLSMSRQDLIKWYDRAFEMFLACMAVLPYSRYRKEVESLTNNKQG